MYKVATAMLLLIAALGLAGCSAVNSFDGSASARTERPPEASATSTVAGPVKSAAEESAITETTTARLVGTPPTIESPSTETPMASVGNPTPEVEVTPPKMPTVTLKAETEEVASDEAEAGRRPTEEQLRLLASLDTYGPAPELHNEVWLNSEPVSLDDLRGKVVMVEFWTFG